MGYRLFHLKVVPDDQPDSDGRWIERVVPDEWPGDDRAQPNMMQTPPDFSYVPSPGYHVVSFEEVAHESSGSAWLHEGDGGVRSGRPRRSVGRRLQPEALTPLTRVLASAELRSQRDFDFLRFRQ